MDNDIFDPVRNNNINKIQKAVRLGADVNILDKNGRTALMWACDKGHIDTVKLLVKHGADMHVNRINGESALSMARKRKHYEVVEYLKYSGKKK